MKTIKRIAGLGIVAALAAASAPTFAGSHTWDVWEVFSNADGTVQFVTIKETNGGTAETGVGGHTMISHPSNHSQSMHSVVGNTAFTFYLLGTAAYAALPGAPAPDTIMPANFIAATDTSMEYSFTDTATWTLGTLPTDGIHSLRRAVTNGPLVVSTNAPQNFAGATGSIDASAPPPGVPQVNVGKAVPDGSSLSVSWNTATCGDTGDHQILYGQKSGLPGSPGGTYTLQAGTCGIGSTSPYTWTPAVSPDDGSDLTWFLVVAKKASGTEGPWGGATGNAERNGPGTGGSSNVCTTTSKSIATTCGH
jgi:hypothetical protein